MSELSITEIDLRGQQLPAPASWATDLRIKVPTRLADAFNSGNFSWSDASAQTLARQAAVDLRERNAYLATAPTSARLPISYQRVPAPLRRMLARGLGRLQRRRQSSWAHFPSWPLDLSTDVLADLGNAPIRRRERTPVMLTHDIDSAEGLANLIKWFLPIEEANGARSANYIVPCAWPIDRGMTSEVMHRGHEIGIHGYDHSNRTPFATSGERNRRLAAGATVGLEFGASGYRAPSLARTAVLIEDLSAYYAYDSSIPTSGGLFPAPNNGCASARPWKVGRMWELPLSMPRDGSLQFLGYSPAQILSLWIESAEMIARSGGVVCLLTHCERGFSGNPAMLASYRSFVEHIAADHRYEFLRPVDFVAELDRQNA